MTSGNTTERISTQELLLILQEAEEVDSLLDGLSPQINAPAFHIQLTRHMEERNLTVSRLSGLTMLSRSFVYQMCSGDRVPGRDIVIRTALALELTVNETQQLLRLAQRGTLYPRVQRDAILIFGLNRRKGLYGTDELLTSHGEAPLL